jgi:hypothetical protein
MENNAFPDLPSKNVMVCNCEYSSQLKTDAAIDFIESNTVT